MLKGDFSYGRGDAKLLPGFWIMGIIGEVNELEVIRSKCADVGHMELIWSEGESRWVQNSSANLSVLRCVGMQMWMNQHRCYDRTQWNWQSS